MKTKKLISALSIVGLGLALSAPPASAAVLWQFQDDDIDFILNPNLTPRTSGPFAVGDIFVSIVEIPSFAINGVPSIAPGTEITGVVALSLTAISTSPPGVGTVYTFAPYAPGLDAILALGGAGAPTVPGGTGQPANQGAMIALFVNGAPGAVGDRDLQLDVAGPGGPATNCTGLSDCIHQASLGSLLQVDGFKTDPDQFWQAVQVTAGGGDIGTVLAGNNTANVASAAFALSNFFNTVPVEFINIGTGNFCGTPGLIADGCVQFTGSANIQGGNGLVNGAIAHSDFDGNKWVVPEPGTLALLGAVLFALGGVGSRRKA